jgi:hypothetical protein
MERICRKRKVNFLDLYEDIEINKKINKINLDFKTLLITRKRKYDIISNDDDEDKDDKKDNKKEVKFVKIYSCSIHDSDKDICNIYNCQGMNYCDIEINNFDYIN